MATLRSRLKRGWNAFLGRDAPEVFNASADDGPSYGLGGYKIQSYGWNKGSATSIIKNKIANDAAQLRIVHAIATEDGDYQATMHTPLNKIFNYKANIDQPSTAFKIDIFESLLSEGGIAIVPTLIDDKVELEEDLREFEVVEARVARVVQYYPQKVRIEIYNERTGLHQEYTIPKNQCALVENPFRSIMNDANSTAKKLERKLALLDRIDEITASGKLDLIIQLPYALKGQKQLDDANKRKSQIAKQLEGSKYGVAYIDSTEKVIQLNRPLENNLIEQIEYYDKRLYTELGLTPEIMNGTADENAMLNYQERVVAPIVTAVTEACTIAFISDEAYDSGQVIMSFRDPLKLVPVAALAELADKLTRNEIMTSNEIRVKIGLPPSDDPKADELRNSNLNHPDESVEAQQQMAGQQEEQTPME